MKKIMIMRHAKSDWADNTVRDFDRPLNKRGKLAAPAMGEEVKKLGFCPDIILSSPALRAKTTAEVVADKCEYNKEIILQKSFYFAYTGEIFQAIKNLGEDIESVMLFGHNPTWSSLAEKLSGEYFNMKTAQLVVLSYEGKWNELKDFCCKVEKSISPKDIM